MQQGREEETPRRGAMRLSNCWQVTREKRALTIGIVAGAEAIKTETTQKRAEEWIFLYSQDGSNTLIYITP